MRNWKQALLAARSGASKYKLLVTAIATDIEQGNLHDGQRLPPQRLLAEQLDISVQTVTNAYKELERQGWVRCEVGRGSFVSRRISERVASSMLDRGENSLVEFSTARLLEALAFPPAAFTCVFAMGRVAGWIAHAREQLAGGRLIRPQSRYVGPTPRLVA